MKAELIVISDLFDDAFTLRDELKSLHPHQKVICHLFTNGETLFDDISKSTRTLEKRFMLDVLCAREG